MCRGECVSRLGSSDQQKACAFPFLEVSNLHHRRRNDYNEVFKRISMESKTKHGRVRTEQISTDGGRKSVRSCSCALLAIT